MRLFQTIADQPWVGRHRARLRLRRFREASVDTLRATRRIRDHAVGRTYRRPQRADVALRATDP
jgi:hypothetical protein